jgi:hypothetical protein
MYVGDFDKNNNPDQLLATARNGKYYPFLGKELLEKQLPYLKKEFLQYSSMAGKTVDEIFKEHLDEAAVFEAHDFSSTILLNNRNKQFTYIPLPAPLQWSPLFAFLPGDFNHDGYQDFIAGGNFYGVIPFEGRYDALQPMICYGNGKGEFVTLPLFSTTIVTGEVRRLLAIRLANDQNGLIVFRNNDRPLLCTFKRLENTRRTSP